MQPFPRAGSFSRWSRSRGPRGAHLVMIGFSDIQPPVVKLLPRPVSLVALLKTVRAVDPENRTEGRLHLNRAGFLLGALQPRRGRTSPWQLAHWPAWASRDVVTDDASLHEGAGGPYCRLIQLASAPTALAGLSCEDKQGPRRCSREGRRRRVMRTLIAVLTVAVMIWVPGKLSA